jgi:hypothetical protein
VYDHGKIRGEVKNITSQYLERVLHFSNIEQTIQLEPGQTYAFESPK